jgi:hypothetical protein
MSSRGISTVGAVQVIPNQRRGFLSWAFLCFRPVGAAQVDYLTLVAFHKKGNLGKG